MNKPACSITPCTFLPALIKVWAGICLLFFFNPVISGQIKLLNVKTLETVNSFPGEWCCVNDGYLYGASTRNVLRKAENGQSFEVRGDVRSVDPSFEIENRIYSTSVPGLIFVLTKNNLGNHFLLKSSDGGATFSISFVFGEGNGTGGLNAGNVRLLRGLLELTRDLPGGGGRGTLYIGEYNVNGFRIRGAANDRVRIMKSVDQGNTWTKVVEWNTNGMNQIGHIHAMKQDPYTGEIYVCTGDDNTKSGIIKWNGISSWRDNGTLAELSTRSGFRVYTGAQRYRACDVLFDRDYFYTFTDTQKPNNPTGSESGIWRGRKDFSSFTRMDNQIYDYDPMHVGWFGDKIGDTFVFTTAREYVDPQNAWKELNTQVYVSNDGINWHRTGSLNWRDYGNPALGRYLPNLFSYNNRLYIDCLQGAGHFSTIQCELVRDWKTGDDPLILHPVYFAGRWNSEGNDANTGTNADAPKKSIGNILMFNNISAGARVRVSEGEFNESLIYPLWSGAVIQGRGCVTVEGRGKDETKIILSPGNSPAGIQLERSRTMTDSNTPLVLKDLELYMNDRTGNTHNNYLLNNTDSYIKTINCRLGGPGNEDSPLVNLASEGSKYESENTIYIANSSGSTFNNILSTSSDNTYGSFRNCIFLNSHIGFEIHHQGTDLRLKNCTFYGSGKAGIVIDANSNSSPFVKNCIFSGGDAAIIDLSGLKETQIDYNYYNGSIVNITDGGHSISGNDPSFVDPENGKFNLNSYSLCAMAGTNLPDVLFDFIKRERKDPPCIGAFEDPALYVLPGPLTLEKSSQVTDLRVISTGDWIISDFDPWIKISALTGSGIGSITMSAEQNNSTEPRIGNITFSGTDASPFKLKIMQLSNLDTSIPESAFDKLKVFPNPVSGLLHIESGDERIISFKILNAAGGTVAKNNTVGLSQDVDFSEYDSGMYILEFATKEGRIRRVKIIKTNKD